MAELVTIGGLTPLMKRLLDRGLLHGDAMTVTGRTLAENLEGVDGLPGGAGGGAWTSTTRSRRTAIS